MMAQFATCPAEMSTVPSCNASGKGPSFVVGTQPQGDPCVADLACAPGLACDTSAGTCQPEGTLNGSCETVSCGAGLYCDGLHCKAAGGASAACSGGDPCQEGPVWLSTSVCSPSLPPAATCGTDHDCQSGSSCDGTCVARKQGGESCTYDSECLSDDCSGTCSPANFCSVTVFGGL